MNGSEPQVERAALAEEQAGEQEQRDEETPGLEHPAAPAARVPARMTPSSTNCAATAGTVAASRSMTHQPRGPATAGADGGTPCRCDGARRAVRSVGRTSTAGTAWERRIVPTWRRSTSAIVRLLAADGRMSYTDLGKATGLSTSAVHQRVRRLEQRGVITGYTITVDHDALELSLTALISIKPIDPAAPDDAPRGSSASPRSRPATPSPATSPTCSRCASPPRARSSPAGRDPGRG